MRAGRLDRAVPLFEQALSAIRASVGDKDSRTLSTMNNMALAYRDQGASTFRSHCSNRHLRHNGRFAETIIPTRCSACTTSV